MSAARTVRLSSRFTLESKIVNLVFDGLLLAGGLYSVGLSVQPFAVVMLLALWVQWPDWWTKEVFANHDGLRVRGLRSEILIPYDQIAEVQKAAWRLGIVHLHLKSDTAFGRHLMFRSAGFTRSAIDILRRRIQGD